MANSVKSVPGACAELQSRLHQAVAHRFPGSRVLQLEPLAGGHAGLTYRCRFLDGESHDERLLVLKLGAPGVRRVGAADPSRQGALLQSLLARGVPVPGIVWAERDEQWLGAPFVLMEWVAGAARFPLATRDEVVPLEFRAAAWAEAIRAIGLLASVPLVGLPDDWRKRSTPLGALAQWEPTLRKSPVSQWVDLGLAAQEALRSSVPLGVAGALEHGDFQPSNLLIAQRTLSAIIDWDLSCYGSAGADAGWLMMWADREYWSEQWSTWCPWPLDGLEVRLRAALRDSAAALNWFHAFAGYRFGAIACLNVHLHRSGRRTDAVWERFALDVPGLFARSRELASALPRS